MTLANLSSQVGRPRTAAAQSGLFVDLALLLAIVALAVALLWRGGLETLGGGLLGAAIAGLHTQRAQAIVSGAFAGLFIGALFAGFFHAALAETLRLIL